MKLVFSRRAWEDYLHWQKVDKKLVKRINDLIKEITRAPYAGTGKPEKLKHALAGYWSRRINDEHRIVCKVTDDSVLITQLRYHYWRHLTPELSRSVADAALMWVRLE